MTWSCKQDPAYPFQGEKLLVSDPRVHGALLGVQQLLREVLLLLLDRMSGKFGGRCAAWHSAWRSIYNILIPIIYGPMRGSKHARP